ncbi:hypothetical protein BD324DRAFT_354002 [Kockovaella imperatae]|uniref:NAD(P)-binding protein n=1 Tax=Kockovaella imperatae TaxID=4999 RepID=A0A1Y1UK20_9TREE|nr:hypothetical protein BD324DRAFT_354002 [Kockovaella imperatae]ORX38398.1 hypothetical protein BD324DRAFT_354002 [Kockovaella imperatae]
MTASPVVLLTGASRGLGLAVLKILLDRHNARVATISRSTPPEFQALLNANRDRCIHVKGDVGKMDDNAALVKTAVDKWGQLDGVIICAGIMSLERIADLTLEDLSNYTAINLLSIPYLVKPALPYLRKAKGNIVLVSSGASTKGYAAWGMYSMVKAGMNSLARTLGAEEKENGVGVWSIRPGMVDTGMQEYLRESGSGAMNPEDLTKFIGAFERGELLPTEKPGAVIAQVAVTGGPMGLTGEYLDWTDDRLKAVSV